MGLSTGLPEAHRLPKYNNSTSIAQVASLAACKRFASLEFLLDSCQCQHDNTGDRRQNDASQGGAPCQMELEVQTNHCAATAMTLTWR